jgi:hypothetical protein
MRRRRRGHQEKEGEGEEKKVESEIELRTNERQTKLKSARETEKTKENRHSYNKLFTPFLLHHTLLFHQVQCFSLSSPLPCHEFNFLSNSFL